MAILLLAGGPSSAQTPAPPTLDVSPLRLTFIADEHADHIAAGRVEVRNTGSGGLVWQARASAPWIQLAPARGLAPATLVVTVDATGLTPGRYTSRIAIEAGTAAGSPRTIDVEVTITSSRPPGPPALQVTPDRVAFSAPPGQSAKLSFPLNVEAEQNASVKWTAQTDQPWLAVTPAEGTTPAVITLSASPAPLSIGDHRATLVVRTAGRSAPIRVPVLFSVENASGAFGFLTTNLPPAVLHVPYSQALAIRGGRAPYTFQLAGSLPSGLALVKGVITGKPDTPGTHAFTVIASDATDPPQTVTETLTLPVLVLDQNAALAVEPVAVKLATSPGSSAEPVTLRVSAGSAPLAWHVTVTARWLHLDPVDGVGTGAFHVAADTTGMKAGTYTASITVSMQGVPNSPVQIPVELTVK